jgi:putative transposase
VVLRHANILAEAGIEPARERNRKRTWKQFLRSHWETLYSCDFFAVETLGVFGSVRYMVFFVMELRSRAVHVAGIRIDPGGSGVRESRSSFVELTNTLGTTNMVHRSHSVAFHRTS